MAYTEILTGHGLTEEQWDRQIASEYIGQLWMRHLMGPSMDAPIQVKMDLTKSAGDAITVGIRSQLKGGKVTGANKGKGNEGRVEFYHFRVVVDNVRHLVKFEDVPMSQKRVGWDILNAGREALVEKSAIDLDESIINELSTTTNRVRGRYLYGAADSNWNSDHATALTNIDNTADQLTTNIIRIAKRKALIPVNAIQRIRPMRVNTGQNFEEWFTFIAHPYCVRDMVDNDAAWRNAQLLIPPQTNRNSPIFTGNSFKGAWDGVLVYEYDRVNLVSSTIQVAHNLLLGAQAGIVAWGQMSKFGEEEEDVGHDMVFETHEIRGIEKVEFEIDDVDSSKNNEDQGLVHTFTAAVAD